MSPLVAHAELTDPRIVGRPPGVYPAAPGPERDVLTAVRMDVCAFVGVAPRGPAWQRTDDPTLVRDAAAPRVRSVAVPVAGWSEYAQIFGTDEGPGLLPHAVAAFFAQGGRRAYVVRIVPAADPPAPEPPACAVLCFGPEVGDGVGRLRLLARNEGSWGNRLLARLTFTATPMPNPVAAGASLVLAPPAALAPGAVVRLTGGQGVVALRLVTAVELRPRPDDGGVDRVAVLDAAPPAGRLRAEVVEADLELRDRDPRGERVERFGGLGLLPEHPRWLGRVLQEQSSLAELPGAVTAALPGSPALQPAQTEVEDRPRSDPPGTPARLLPTGFDRYTMIVPSDVLGELGGEDEPPAGLGALRDLPDVAGVVVCDLYSPAPPPASSDVGSPAVTAGPSFGLCLTIPGSPPTADPVPELAGLRRDPAGDLPAIIELQRTVVDAAERLGLTALLDVPPGLAPQQVLAWRAHFDSSYAAAYHGWPRRPYGAATLAVPPSAYAAGGIAASEATRGVPHGPARLRLAGAVDVDTAGLAPAVLGELHHAGINVLVLDRDGVRISAARTLSRDRAWRQLTARRVVSQLARTIEAQLQWATFEPAGRALRTTIRLLVEDLLIGFQRAGAFAGAGPETSFFVRVPPPAPGFEEQVLCEIGVAPSEPIEFVLLRVVRAGDGGLRAEVGDD